MGISGVTWKASKKDIIDTLKKRNGVISRAANDLGVHRHTLTKRICEDADLQELIAVLRNDFIEQKLDDAEETVLFAMNRREEDLGNALKASFFVLNNLGRHRGYVHPRIAEKEIEESALELRREIVMEGEIKRRVAKALQKRGIIPEGPITT